MLPLWMGGYCMYVLITLLPLSLLYIRKIDGACLSVIAFSLIYTLFQYENGHPYTGSSLIFDLTFPFIVYQVGTYIVTRQKSPKSAVLLLCLIAIALALPVILVNVKDTITTGQMINVERVITGESDEEARSATGYGMMLAILDGCFGIILLKPSGEFDSRLKIAVAIMSCLALFATIHLLNRTGIVLAAISILCVVLLPPYSFKKIIYTVVSLILVGGITIYFLEDSKFYIDAINFYEARDSGSGSVNSFGGRSPLWEDGIKQLSTKPLGNDKGVYIAGHYKYAHNMWLDTGIVAGIPAMMILIWIGIIYIQSLIKMYRLKYLNQFEKNLLILIGVAMFLQLNTEPVIQGVYQFFLYFIFFISIINNMNKKYGRRFAINTKS